MHISEIQVPKIYWNFENNANFLDNIIRIRNFIKINNIHAHCWNKWQHFEFIPEFLIFLKFTLKLQLFLTLTIEINDNFLFIFWVPKIQMSSQNPYKFLKFVRISKANFIISWKLIKMYTYANSWNKSQHIVKLTQISKILTKVCNSCIQLYPYCYHRPQKKNDNIS